MDHRFGGVYFLCIEREKDHWLISLGPKGKPKIEQCSGIPDTYRQNAGIRQVGQPRLQSFLGP